ncbi:sigma-54 dependent transcriptional regulator [Granulicella paludicola]|uniref:sigma-54 dependent transcriptional regulator n=1 Tax=Granulicella paludicola TaxID=474951 RepID=UPI0021DFFDD8|nr:sigma 54-interacting transcriptional regulator [Granulicella paludicola]
MNAIEHLDARSAGEGRRVVIASADGVLRQKLVSSLNAMRWVVREASGGAEAISVLEEHTQDALLLDEWLPDLEVGEFAGNLAMLYPGLEVLRVDGQPLVQTSGVQALRQVRSSHRQELLHSLREAQSLPSVRPGAAKAHASAVAAVTPSQSTLTPVVQPLPVDAAGPTAAVDDMIGESTPIKELARLIRLVAPRSTTVLIEGETGTGKELVAQALHRLSPRAKKPLVVLNCAAIPEALLEAELFGHARGAFTGAVQSRTGRIEAADGGTLFLDEIGEMPLGLQAKMLRFLQSGELQRVGENELIHVNVRIIAATHQHLEKRAAEGAFRLDLYHRLAVFPLEVPALRDRCDDIALLAEHFLELLGRDAPRKRLSASALEVLKSHNWPGNVRELAHVLERGTILAGDSAVLRVEEIRLRGGRR